MEKDHHNHSKKVPTLNPKTRPHLLQRTEGGEEAEVVESLIKEMYVRGLVQGLVQWHINLF
jgi:hypothetical protein